MPFPFGAPKRREPAIPRGRNPSPLPCAPANSAARSSTGTSFCAQLTQARLSCWRPQGLFSPSSRRALHSPAGSHPAPWPWHQGAAATEAVCPRGRTAACPCLRRRWSPPALRRGRREWCRLLRACCPLGAGWRWQSTRLCLRRARDAPHASRARASPRCTRRGRGASRRGGRG
jgi:hypothetical protein